MGVLTTKQAAHLVGRDPSWIRLLAAQGRLKGAQKIGRDWQIPEAALKAYMAKEPHPGRPRSS